MTTAMSINNLDKNDAEDVAWGIIEALSSLDDKVGALVAVSHLMRDFYGTTTEKDEKIIQNPFFLANGHEGRSKKTRSYLKSRSFKSLGGSAVGAIGALATPVTLVDVGGIAQHTNAVVTTTGHLIGIKAAGSSFKRSQTITRWVDAMMAAKSAKMGVRVAGLAGAAIPVPAVSLGTGIATAIAKLGIKLTLGKLIARTAMEVHWRSKQELVLGRGIGGIKSGACGPASAMFYEVFTKRGATRIFGKYDTEQLISEPGGWMALNDKLMLM